MEDRLRAVLPSVFAILRLPFIDLIAIDESIQVTPVKQESLPDFNVWNLIFPNERTYRPDG